ncbi:hypothetical protein [Oligoflexus tunisiensis]|uniref:hypothetical protein n=1 Tax=Oligoflexus tunisiensis TaxID=708132 RepID=UPI00159F1B1C|nr:hypothetical protein [Oligoflexus tunisiensis]
MENTERKSRLRLVKANEDQTADERHEQPQTEQLKSAFAKQVNGFADELDRMIATILNS